MTRRFFLPAMMNAPAPLTRATFDPNRAIRIKRAHDYPVQIWAFLACFLGILTLYHIGVLFIFWQRKRHARRAFLRHVHEESVDRFSPIATYSSNCHSIVCRIPLAVLTSFRILLCRITVPVGEVCVLNGAEMGIIAGYIAALFTWEFINCMNVKTGVKLDVLYWANRAGCIARSQYPLLVVLAGKNNIISLLTGVSYEKLNVLHRAAARVCLILIWVHFLGRVHKGLGVNSHISHPWVRAGIMAATAYTILVIISFRPLRTRFYEFVVFSHFILVLVVLIGSYFHMRRGFGRNSFSEIAPYLIPTFILWVLDRAVRLLRVFRNGRNSVTAKSRVNSDAVVELLSPTMVRVVLRRRMTWKAGQSAFLTMPSVSNLPFEAHPFTIASVPKHEVCSVSASGTSSGASSNSSKVNGGQDADISENEIVFFIRVRNGFTRRLQEAVQRQRNLGCSGSWCVYIDGPYGSPPDLNAFQNVILVAGGSGMSYTLPMLQHLIQSANHGSTVCSSVFFIWIVPHRSEASWISETLFQTLEAAPQALMVRIQIHVTQNFSAERYSALNPTSDDTEKHFDDMMNKFSNEGRVTVQLGRPDVHALLDDELSCAEGHVSVDVAGPATLAEDVRKALCSGVAGPMAVLKGRPDVTLHVETYGIA